MAKGNWKILMTLNVLYVSPGLVSVSLFSLTKREYDLSYPSKGPKHITTGPFRLPVLFPIFNERTKQNYVLSMQSKTAG